ncbi:hypothetical protein HDF22_004279 [Mucilaginibacter lappiensis]|uniref:Uncharacterized protein n=1 Tax=Mucilaginibacter lappiensis TaxID=354630 RepID=A0A841JGX5_9SPHI|nr:hypothetical protein [Mucilaginibacter lappiensis]
MNVSQHKQLRKITLITSISLLLLSLTQQAYCTPGRCTDSIAIYISGLFGFYLSSAGIVWLANPLLLISWITVKRYFKLSLITSLLATIISIAFLFFTKIIDNSGGYYNRIISYKLGYWLWVCSALVMFVGTAIYSYILKRSDE